MSSPHTIPNDVDPKCPLVVVMLSNILKLTSTNYLSWKLQIEATLFGYGLFKYLDGTFPAPPTTITMETVSEPNPAYLTWVRQDKLLFGALIGTLEPTLVPLISRSRTTQEVWDTLAHTFARLTRGHIKQLKTTFKALTKDPEDITDKVLESLDSTFQGVIDAVHARDTPISFDELHEKLLNRELMAKSQPIMPTLPASVHATTTRLHYNTQLTPTNHFRPTSTHKTISSNSKRSTQPGPRGYQGKCQWCHTIGHSLHLCPIFQEKYPAIHPPPRPTSNPSQPQAHVATASISSHPSPWLLDTGASHHVTHDLANLSLHHPYDGTKEIVIGNGTGIPITHTGSLFFPTSSSKSLSLSNVSCAPTMTRNIISISQLCSENNLIIEFTSNSFVVKDRLTGAQLIQGPTRHGIYEWPSPAPILAFSSVKASALAWHHRLGHPSLSTFKNIVSNFRLHVSSDFSFNCNSCHCNKSHKLPFSQSTLISNAPLDLIYTDLWTSPLYSIDGYKYYVIFVDHFTKYIWFYSLKNKSDTKVVFIRFKALVEKYFEKNIKAIYSDNGGEYQALATFLTIDGVSHLTSPPHTSEHNGYAERRHRHIVETGLSLLAHAQLPLEFWSYSFATAAYLINRLPTPTLSNSSPYHRLFGAPPNYLKLRSFGCLCYPWLRPYASHKLDPKSIPCIFIGYSKTQSAYYCLDPTTHKVYTSRHVQFVETEFPYARLSTCTRINPMPNPDHWCPLSLPIIQPVPIHNPRVNDNSLTTVPVPNTPSEQQLSAQPVITP
ncbi:hypothetical protein L6164_008664 [Bauhinia variegata]|uniref:Uncharacterized protein n=1 Tax=Bauhinia variegata TaxID=167791 RepID=A0ACB9PHN9_BAUVA|nr:hypothetical protein L6164_008664 [Bauhinia variegata]